MTSKMQRNLARKNYGLMLAETEEIVTTTETDSNFEIENVQF